jgi:hypothetical protein
MKNLTPRINNLEPNLVIDGGFEIWPEGTSRNFTTGASGYGSILFQHVNAGSGVTTTNSQQASVPAGTNIPFSNQISKSASGTLATSAVVLQYYTEGYDTQKILNTDFSVIFWVKSSVASNRSLSVRNGNDTHSFVQQYNIAAANTWQLVALKIPALSTCPGTFSKTNGRGLITCFSALVGNVALQTATLNSWQSGSFYSGVGEDTTWMTGTNHDFSIAGVMILPGDFTGIDAATYNFVRAGRNFGEELSLTQRYFEKSYEFEVSPGTNTENGAIGIRYFNMAVTPYNNRYYHTYRAAKRTTITPSFYSITGTLGSWSGAGGPVSVVAPSGNGFQVEAVSPSGSTTDWWFRGHFVADARF